MPDSTRNSSKLPQRLVAPLAWAVLGLGFAACSSTKASTAAGAPANSIGSTAVQGGLPELMQPTSEAATRISVKAYEVQAIRSNEEYVRLFEWFQNQGELAYPKLLEMAGGSHTGAREFAMSIIAARSDDRLLPYFQRDVPEPSQENTNLYLGYHRSLVALGDTSSIPVLIDGMEVENPKKRAIAHRALELATRNGIAFDPMGSPEGRAASVQAWRDWYEAQSNDPLLQGQS